MSRMKGLPTLPSFLGFAVTTTTIRRITITITRRSIFNISLSLSFSLYHFLLNYWRALFGFRSYSKYISCQLITLLFNKCPLRTLPPLFLPPSLPKRLERFQKQRKRTRERLLYLSDGPPSLPPQAVTVAACTRDGGRRIECNEQPSISKFSGTPSHPPPPTSRHAHTLLSSLRLHLLLDKSCLLVGVCVYSGERLGHI